MIRAALPVVAGTAKIQQPKVEVLMQVLKFIHWQDGDMFLGYLEEYPDYWTQGDSLDELRENLAELFRDISSGTLPGIRKVDELVIS
jgi:hypothetical protein